MRKWENSTLEFVKEEGSIMKDGELMDDKKATSASLWQQKKVLFAMNNHTESARLAEGELEVKFPELFLDCVEAVACFYQFNT